MFRQASFVPAQWRGGHEAQAGPVSGSNSTSRLSQPPPLTSLDPALTQMHPPTPPCVLPSHPAHFFYHSWFNVFSFFFFFPEIHSYCSSLHRRLPPARTHTHTHTHTHSTLCDRPCCVRARALNFPLIYFLLYYSNESSFLFRGTVQCDVPVTLSRSRCLHWTSILNLWPCDQLTLLY